ncbi:MAG: hypothetical protein E7570_03905 [Ruminococcaceae bacterium]|nr:hypothetical protein [Oscillospiraceae bacterium]
MDKTLSISELDVFSAVYKRDANQMRDIENKYIKFSSKLINDNKYDELQSLAFNQKARLSRIFFEMDNNNNTDYFVGRASGIIDILEQISNTLVDYKNRLDSINDNDIKNIPHIDNIIFNIANNEGVRHGKLSELTKIEKNNLSGLMKRIDKTVVISVRQGKYKHYYLTDFGKKYYENNLKYKKTEANLDKLIEEMAITISTTEDKQYALTKFISLLLSQDNSSMHKSFSGNNINTYLYFRNGSINSETKNKNQYKTKIINSSLSNMKDLFLNEIKG